ncbi:MAG: thioesterase family protein [Paracoccaceae bacterium]
MIFHHPQRIEFNHCDPAGIVFYPRYFEMTNSTVETFFREVAGHSYAAMMLDREGVPTARIEANFHAPSRLEEVLDWQLTVTRLGGSSITFHLEAHCDGSHRLTADLTLVYVASNGRPQPWPPAVRDRITAYMEAT